MNTSTVILNTATILRAIGRASLAVAWLFAHHTSTAGSAKPVEPAAEVAAYVEAAPYVDAAAGPVIPPLAARSDCPRNAPIRFIETPVEVPAARVEEQHLPAPRSKCGDLPRAPWNTCVALHDHEI